MILLQSELGFELVLALFLLDVVDDRLRESLVPHEVLALVQAMIRVGGCEELPLLIHVRNVRVASFTATSVLGRPGSLISLLESGPVLLQLLLGVGGVEIIVAVSCS